ncbi:hypothetical protein ABGM91_01065 [Akkermansia muciniphila]|uniref:hypothetical protein n=1 Tax=Akkermansia muciniphila TaxID=239935 RepID=UPI0033A0FC57
MRELTKFHSGINSSNSRTFNPNPSGSGLGTVTIKVTSTKYESEGAEFKYLAKCYPIKTGFAYEVPIYKVVLTSTKFPGVDSIFYALRFMPSKTTANENVFMSGLADAQNYVLTTYDPNYNPHSMQNLENGAFLIYGNFLVHAGPSQFTHYAMGGLGCIEVFDFASFVLTIINLCGAQAGGTTDEVLTRLAEDGYIKLSIEAAVKPPVTPVAPPPGYPAGTF